MKKETQTLVHAVVTILLVFLSIVIIFAKLPIEREMREVQKIFYYHVGIAWTMFLAFLITAIGGVVYLARRNPKSDIVAGCSAELGFLYATLVLATGMLWARSAWNTWWNWEPRLTSTLVLWLIYAAYLLFRSSTRGERKRRFASVFGIVAFVMVPIVYFSINLWGSLLHPKTSTVRQLDPVMYWGMALGGFTMISVYLFVLFRRIELEEVAEELDRLKRDLMAERT